MIYQKILLVTTLWALSLTSHSEQINADSVERKNATESFLTQRNIPVNPHLPYVESIRNAKLQNAEDVAKRVIVLYHVASVGFGIEPEIAIEFLEKNNLWDSASPEERAFLETSNPTKQQLVNATWRVESIWVLLWALGDVDDLDFPTRQISADEIHRRFPSAADTARFIAESKLRSAEQILDATDMIYRIHWAVRDAQLKGQETPGGVDAGVVLERHYSLNWLTLYAEEWDDVTTDT